MPLVHSPDEVRISPNPAVFDLPVLVARDEDLFTKHGVTLNYTAEYSDRSEEHGREVLSRLKEAHFIDGKSDAYNVCEWGGIDRIERGTETAKIAALRPSVAAQAIVSFDKSLQTPRDLAEVEIGVNEFTGSYYTTIQLLESALGTNHVKLTHIGEPSHRYDALKSGEVRAVTVMEPFISLALKEGAHIVALTFYRGAEIINPKLPEAVRRGYFAAFNEAVALINADFGRYAHHIAKATKGRLRPEELSSFFVRYEPVEQYAQEKFDSAYQWMASRNLSAGKNDHASLVVA